MKYLLLATLATVLVFGGCDDDCSDIDGGDTDTTECSGSNTQCAGDMVQHCVDGSWINFDDCAAWDATCVVAGGEAECFGSGVDAGADF